MTKSREVKPKSEDKYLVLQSDVYLKDLEEPAVYKTTSDSLYEVDQKTSNFLRGCNGLATVSELDPPAEFLQYILEENIASLLDKACERASWIGVNTRPSLRYLLVETTSRCNLSCKHCYQGNAKAVDLGLETFVKLTREFESMGGLRLIISGGEPLLHPEFSRINQLMKNRAFRSILLTNGTLLDDSIIEELCFNEVQVSLDGLEEGHDKLRGKGSFQRSIEALKMLRQRGIAVSIASMIHAHNYGEFAGLKDLVEDLGAISWTIDVPSRSGRLAENDWLMPPLDCVERIMELQFGAMMHDSHSNLVCGAHLGCVKSDGCFTKCGFYTKWTSGDINQGLRSCWLALPRMNITELDCDCEFLEECRGGCRYRAECYNGEKGADPIKCLLYGVKRFEQ